MTDHRNKCSIIEHKCSSSVGLDLRKVLKRKNVLIIEDGLILALGSGQEFVCPPAYARWADPVAQIHR